MKNWTLYTNDPTTVRRMARLGILEDVELKWYWKHFGWMYHCRLNGYGL